jgi:hypothetical protein
MEAIFGILALMLIGCYLLTIVTDLIAGDWYAPVMVLGLILFVYGAIQVKSNQPHGSGMMIIGITAVIVAWIFVGINSKK